MSASLHNPDAVRVEVSLLEHFWLYQVVWLSWGGAGPEQDPLVGSAVSSHSKNVSSLPLDLKPTKPTPSWVALLQAMSFLHHIACSTETYIFCTIDILQKWKTGGNGLRQQHVCKHSDLNAQSKSESAEHFPYHLWNTSKNNWAQTLRSHTDSSGQAFHCCQVRTSYLWDRVLAGGQRSYDIIQWILKINDLSLGQRKTIRIC